MLVHSDDIKMESCITLTVLSDSFIIKYMYACPLSFLKSHSHPETSHKRTKGWPCMHVCMIQLQFLMFQWISKYVRFTYLTYIQYLCLDYNIRVFTGTLIISLPRIYL